MLQRPNLSDYFRTVKELKAKYDLVWQIEMGGGVQKFICYKVGDDPDALARKFVEVNGIYTQYDKIKHFIVSQIERARNDPTLSHMFKKEKMNDPTHTHMFKNETPSVYKHFPYNGAMLSYSTAQYPLILNKINEFNSTLSRDPMTMHLALSAFDLAGLTSIVPVLEGSKQLNVEHFQSLTKALKWPSLTLFPILDLIRMVADNWVSGNHTEYYLNIFRQVVTIGRNPQCTSQNLFLILKTIVNFSRRDTSKRIIVPCYEEILLVFENAASNTHKTVLNCLSSAMLNYTLLALDFKNSKVSWAKILVKILLIATEEDTILKALVALGTLLLKVVELRSYQYESMELKEVVQKYTNSSNQQIKECTLDLNSLVTVGQ